ncbi:Exonuclease SbcC [hydrothermal vent metagenome]|uniref:Exonuclease SbcC n=1 Tax=hydrothermal vent metagenome TaxID=652676 RepID=A0A3B0Z0H8_9ZZZZ
MGVPDTVAHWSFAQDSLLAHGGQPQASKNVWVDSLFLDEDALDTALETLGGLQTDRYVSHVLTLKERISTQIQVRSYTGGRSVISGPGCSRLD